MKPARDVIELNFEVLEGLLIGLLSTAVAFPSTGWRDWRKISASRCPPRRSGSNLFYQVISTRHSQRKSTVITTNHCLLRVGQYPVED